MNTIKNILTIASTSLFAALALTATASALTRIEGDGVSTFSLTHAGTGYWHGEFVHNNLAQFGDTYSDSKYAEFIVDNGNSAKIVGKSSYEGNYKYVSVTLVGRGDSSYHNWSGNKTTVWTSTTYPDQFYKGTYMGAIYNGTGSTSEFLDGYQINVEKNT